ncbi:MAG: hypothetical protein ABI612_03040 [Betaproteobacteria bacterium]
MLSVPAWSLGATCRVVDGALEVGGGHLRGLVARLPCSMQFAAITFGHVIIGVDHNVLARLRSHEHVHVRQYERWGIVFFVLYAGSSLLALLRGRHPYRDNHFEREAYGLAETPAVGGAVSSGQQGDG